MEKLLKRVVSVVCAIALVVTCISFTPATVNAGEKLDPDVWTPVGGWELYNGNDAWCSYATMEYTSTGDALGDTTMTLTNSPNGDWNDVEYGLGARIKNFVPAEDSADAWQADTPYTVSITINASKAGTLITNVEGNENRLEVAAGGVTVTTDEFDHNFYTDEDKRDCSLYFGMFPKDTVITITEVKAKKNDNPEWTAVPNYDPDVTPGDPTYTDAAPLKLFAMFSPTSTLYGKLKYKFDNDVPATELAHTKVLVNSASGWNGAYSTCVKLEDYIKNYRIKQDPSEEGTPLVANETYAVKIVVNVSQKTGEDEHHKAKKLRCIVGGQQEDFALTRDGDNTINIASFKCPSDPKKQNVEFVLDELEKDTVFTIKSVDFSSDDPDWNKVDNGTTQKAGPWQLFARTGDTVQEGQWGALSWQKADGVVEPTNMGDINIKVRSSSGWHNAWATMATLPDFIEGKLSVGKTYNVLVTYTSSQATGTDDAGDPKTVLFSVDNNNMTFSLKEGREENKNIGQFVYEKSKPEKPYDVIFNLDQVEPGTILNIESIVFDPVDDGWRVVPNKEYIQVGNTSMELYARMGDTVQEGSWGKTSYRFDDYPDESSTDYSDVLIKTRTTSGWYVTNNPASVIDFPGLAAAKMKEANSYRVKVKVKANRSDEIKALDGSPDAIYNNLAITVDGNKQYFFDTLPDGTSYEAVTDYFVYEKKSDDLRLVLDEFTKNATIRVESIEFEKNPEDTDWTPVPNATATKVGAWTLYANFNASTESWGKMLYHNESATPEAMGDTKMYCYSTSGWIGARSIRATLNNYTQGKLTVGQNYATYITIDSTEDCFGTTTAENGDVLQNGIQVTIDDSNYMIPIYKGEHVYCIPKLTKVYQKQNKDNVTFDFDKLTPKTVVKISDVRFDDPISEPVALTAFDAVAQTNGQVKVTWEQTANTVYGTAGNEGTFKIFVDNVCVDEVNGTVREYTTGVLSEGDHKIAVVATLGAKETNPVEKTVTVAKETTTAAPTTAAPTQAPTTEAPTQAPTEKPTVAPTTTKAKPKAPGKTSVKKIAKRKKSAKKIKITINKATNAKGYEVAVYKNKKCTKLVAKKTTTSTKVTIKSKKIKKKKKLYVKVRAYNLNGATKIYGPWSKAKKSKAKKK